MSKKRVAFFDFASCEGCQLQMANFGEAFLDVLNLMDVVMFREVMSEKTEDYDMAIVEGSITTPHDVERIRHIRQRAKVVIALGSCATDFLYFVMQGVATQIASAAVGTATGA